MKVLTRRFSMAVKVSVFSFLTLSALPAVSEQVDGEWLLAKYDLNGDDLITQDEISLKKNSIFRQLDMNHDGAVTFDEYETMDLNRRHVLLKARFGKLDKDRNGAVDNSEYSAYMGSFNSIDADGDGTLSSKEVASAGSSVEKVKEDNTHCFFWVCVRTRLD